MGLGDLFLEEEGNPPLANQPEEDGEVAINNEEDLDALLAELTPEERAELEADIEEQAPLEVLLQEVEIVNEEVPYAPPPAQKAEVKQAPKTVAIIDSAVNIENWPEIISSIKESENLAKVEQVMEEYWSNVKPEDVIPAEYYAAIDTFASKAETSEQHAFVINFHTHDSHKKLENIVNASPEEQKKFNDDIKEMAKEAQANPDVIHHKYEGKKNALAENAHTTSERVHHMITHTDAKDFDVNVVQATLAQAEVREAAQHKSVATAAATHAGTAVNSAMDTAATRLVSVAHVPSAPSISSPGSDLQTSSAEGIAAGSSVEKYGVWGQVMGGVATQKARKGASGFKSNMIGSMIGADTMINDNTTIGIAFGNVANNVKMKGIQKGDKTKSSSWVFSGYGSYKFDNDFFLSGAVAYTRTAIDNKDKRTINANQKGIARAKYNINSFGGELIVGKAFAVKDFTVIPSIGARLTHTGKISYQETGNTGLNNKVSQAGMNSVYGIAGLQAMKSFAYGSAIVTPDLHANVQYGLGTKTPTGKFTSQLDSKAVSYVGNKPSRFSSTIGAGVTAESGAFEYGVTYDANIAAGYVGHQGAVKLKVKF